MKRLLLILFVALWGFATSAQSYIDTSAVSMLQGYSVNQWNGQVEYYAPSGVKFTGFVTTNDTVFARLSFFDYCDSGQISDTFMLLRQDSSGNIFGRNPYLNNEIWLFNPNLEQGDSVDIRDCDGWADGVLIIDSVTQLTWSDNLPRRKWYFHADLGWRFTWIEGIGSEDHGFYPVGYCCIFDVPTPNLRCVIKNDDVLWNMYTSPVSYDCCVNLSTTELTRDALEVFPNPANDVVQVKLPVVGERWRMANAMGQWVAASSAPIVPGNISISTADLPSGVYVLMVDAGSLTYTARVLVQH